MKKWMKAKTTQTIQKAKIILSALKMTAMILKMTAMMLKMTLKKNHLVTMKKVQKTAIWKIA